MTVSIANTELTNSFNTWRLNTNHMATVISNNVVTVSRAGDANRNAVSVGNGHIKGTFTANELRTTTLRSGNTSNPGGWLYVTSNTVINATSLAITANTTFSGNVIFNTAGTDRVDLGSISRIILSGGSKGHFLRVASEDDNIEFKALSLRDIADLSTNSAPIILSAANTSYSDNGDTPHIKFANANDAIHVFMGGGEGGSGISDLLVKLADAGASSRLVIADSSNVAVAYIDSDGTIYAAKDLTVDGATVLNGNITLGDADTDTITPKGKFANLAVTGTASFNGTTNFNGTMNINGNVNVGDHASDTLTVTSAAGLNGSVDIGDANTDTLTVASEVDSNFVPATDNTYLLGKTNKRWKKLFATSISASEMAVAGNQTITGQLRVTQNVEVTGNTNVNGTLTANNGFTTKGTATFNGNVTLGDDQTDTITVKGKFANQSTTGTASFNGDVYLGNASTDTITVKGKFSNQYTSGTGNFNKLGVKIPSVTTGYDAEVKNSVKIGQNLTVSGNTSITGRLNVTGGITIPANTIIAVANGEFDNIIVNNDAVFGTDAANTVTFNSVVGSNFTPKTGSRYNLGATGSRWHYLYANNVSLNSSIAVAKNATISGNTTISKKATIYELAVTKNIVVSGNLTVSGTTTTINTETINLADNIIKLNSNASGGPTEDAGIAVNRGTSANAELRWDESNDYWKIHSGGTYTGRILTTGDTASGGALANYYTVSNTNIKFQTIATSKAYLANTNARVNLVNSNLTGTNTALRTLISDRMQVANVISYTAKYLEVANVSATDTSTLATWSALTSTNTALRTLISDRMQVANTKAYLANTNAYIATKVNTTTFNSALANTNAYIATKVNTTTFNSALANTNAYIATKLNSSSYTTADVRSKAALANTNAYIASVSATERSALANTNAYIATKLNSSSYTTADVRSKAALANTNAYIASVSATERAALANTNAYIASVSAAHYTDSDVDSHLSGGTGVTYSSGTISIDQAVGTSSSVQFGSFGVGTAASGTTGEIRATNNITAYYSDARLKNFLGTIPNALDKVKALNGYYFQENEVAKSLGYDNDARQVGVSAQEVEAILPEIVTEAPIDPEYKTVYYEKLVPVLIEAIKELSDKVDALTK